MTQNYTIAFWNLENLFDVENSPRRSDKLSRAIGKKLKGWDITLLNAKVKQLAKIIIQMNGGKGPDVLGICEVENEYVMNLLVSALNGLGRNYGVAHDDMNDKRGIDVGFIYDKNLFRLDAQFSHFVLRRTATRDLFQVNFYTNQDQLLVLVGNHWPSRSGGVERSAGYRAIAGETLAYFHERILEVHGKNTPILVMGDFNDEPFDKSLEEYALSTRIKTQTTRGRSPRLLNLMWPLLGAGKGSFFFKNISYVLDQFLANKNLLKQNSSIRVVKNTIEIFCPVEMTKVGSYPSPIAFGGMGKPVNLNGYSDHFPILVKLTERSK